MDALDGIPKEIRTQVDLTMGVSDRIASILHKRGMSQKEFAKMMGRTEAEVSRWLSGTHNFTLSTLAKISAALDAEIVRTCD